LQQYDHVLRGQHGLAARAYHGNDSRSAAVTGWGPQEWAAELQEVEVLVMTPEVLLHVLCHAGLQVRPWVHTKHRAQHYAHSLVTACHGCCQAESCW
jgi:hypothetical protein